MMSHTYYSMQFASHPHLRILHYLELCVKHLECFFGIWNHCLGAHFCDKGLLLIMYMVVVLVDMPDDVQAV